MQNKIDTQIFFINSDYSLSTVKRASRKIGSWLQYFQSKIQKLDYIYVCTIHDPSNGKGGSWPSIKYRC